MQSSMNYKFPVIVADPPYPFKGYTKTGIPTRKDTQDYTTMSLEDIENIPINLIAAKDSVLYLWTTDYMLPQSLKIMEKWGFTYSSVAFYWVKTTKSAAEGKVVLTPTEGWHMGMGYRTRSNPEQVLVGTKGKAVPILSHSIRKLTIAPVKKHSEKPEIVQNNIENLHNGPYIELFARRKRDNWVTMGFELSGKDICTEIIDFTNENGQL